VTSPRSDTNEAGFTLLEVLIALALIAVSLVAIGSVMSTNARGVRSLEQHVALMQTTRSVMTSGIPPRSDLQPGISEGRIDDYHWTVEVTPLGGGWTVPDADVPWLPELVRVRVKSPIGTVSDIRTVRLMKRPPQ
jgi:general secretion pathway protein I